MYPQIENYLAARVAHFADIQAPRRKTLDALRGWLEARREAGEPLRLLFVCTHNSRRSQMAQIWAKAASWHYGIPEVEPFSGGTEATGFNIRAMGAVRRGGFAVATRDEGDNPRWRLRFDRDAEPIVAFSKTITDAANPNEGFCAVMVCSDADAACPTVAGADLRLALPYEDPRHADGTLEEIDAYDQCCAEIARDLAYVFSRMKPS